MQNHHRYINVKENRRGNQEWKIQRNWQHWVHKTQNDDKQTKNTTQHNMRYKYTQANTIEHGPSYKQLEVTTTRTSL